MVSVSEGESITITCTATGAPVPSVNWSRADGSSLTDSRYVISDTSSVMIVNEVYQVTRNLTIVNVVREDIGVEYGCTVTSVVDTVQSNVSITVLCKLIIIRPIIFISRIMAPRIYDMNIRILRYAQNYKTHHKHVS